MARIQHKDSLPPSHNRSATDRPTLTISTSKQKTHLLVTVAAASPTLPKKFSTVSKISNSTPNSSADAFTSARRDPLKGFRASPAAASASALAAVAETFQETERGREAPPEEARPSRRKVPQRPTV